MINNQPAITDVPLHNKRQVHLQLIRTVLVDELVKYKQAEATTSCEEVEDGHDGNGAQDVDLKVKYNQNGHK